MLSIPNAALPVPRCCVTYRDKFDHCLCPERSSSRLTSAHRSVFRVPARRTQHVCVLSSAAAGQDVTRREVISTAGGILLSGACWPACAAGLSDNGSSKGKRSTLCSNHFRQGACHVLPLQLKSSCKCQPGSEDLAAKLTSRVHEFTLNNGLHFIVLERHIAPIVSCHTYADVGAFDEVNGQTGQCHLLPVISYTSMLHV